MAREKKFIVTVALNGTSNDFKFYKIEYAKEFAEGIIKRNKGHEIKCNF